MGHNLRRNFPVPVPSSDPLLDRLNEFTQMNSDSSSSGVTIESFRDPTANATPGQTMVWTNEKHNSYIEFLETSFAEQLHYSMRLRGCYPQEEMWEPCPAPQLPAKFSVLQDGCYLKSNDPLLDSTADSSDVLGNPLYYSTSAAKSSSATFPFSRKTAVPNGRICSRSNTNLGACTTEVSDQNFVEEELREKTSCVSGAKRLKMMPMLDASSNSQVSPFGKLNSADDSIISHTSAKRGIKKK
ncbi:F-box only 43 [Gossypium arboreum]|uniref:F-box only 43 n=2 Tax=Gossypium arboreum TaxID=29729 RepID=A0A0B0ME35_GOSAR|nr:cold-regulated protein 28-like isoform X1 [Gossypium arboreum]KAK5843944.1 hypothetical protein PVK06_000079 [Gossypium arboreum]KHF99054.1 F-box only 43 [Gossypium arboreum]